MAITTKNIILVYHLANPSEIKHGLTWYVNALTDCKKIANDLDLPIHIVVGVVSALSPNNKWEIGAFVNNLEDNRIINYASFNGGTINIYNWNFGAPRLIGLRTNFNF